MKVDDLTELLTRIEMISKNYDVMIWGTGVYGDLLGKIFNKKGYRWKGYIDNFPKSINQEVNGKHVFSGRLIDTTSDMVIVLSMQHYQPVIAELINRGFRSESLIWINKLVVFEQMQNMLINSEPYRMRIKQYQGIHQGEACVLIGNGPSLTIEDLDYIHELRIPCFASNMIYRCYPNTKWRPDYHFFVDINGIREIFSEENMLQYISKNCEAIFTRSDGMLFEYRDDPYISNLFFFDSRFSLDEKKIQFSEECHEKIYIGYSVTYAMLQIAAYMGFKTIYLIGMDHNYSIETHDDSGEIVMDKSIEDHSEILGKPAMWGVADIYKITQAYESAKEYAERHNIEIYNVTRGGRLEVFERKNLEDVGR